MKNNSQKRNFIRVKVYFPVEFSYLNDTDHIKEKKKIINNSAMISQNNTISEIITGREKKNIDPLQLKIWISLDAKLDHIIKLLDDKENKKTDSSNGICVDIGGNGFKMVYHKLLKPGQLLKICINPPTIIPPLQINAIGRVMRSSAAKKIKSTDPDQILYGIKFDSINEDDREKLIKYIFQRQREILRNPDKV